MAMDYDKFLEGIEDIFATFGRKRPDDRIVEIIYRRIIDLPDSFMDFAIKHFEDEESLPKNLGKFLLRDLWPDYLERNPDLKFKEIQCCPKCSPDIPGWRKVYIQEMTGWGEKVWKPVIMRCSCGNAPNPRHEKVYTDLELQESGYSLSCPFHFDREEMKQKYGHMVMHQESEKPENSTRRDAWDLEEF